MSKFALVLGILCIVLALAMPVLAEGLRRWYVGFFFAVIGVVMLVNAARWGRMADKK